MALQDFAQGSQHGLYLVAETIPGTTPASPTMVHVRHTTCNLGLKRTKMESAEANANRNLTAVRLGNYNVAGDIGFEMNFSDGMDALLESLMGSSFTTGVLQQGTTVKSFTIIRRMTDISQVEVFTGCRVSSMSLTIRPNEIVKGTFSIVGIDMSTTEPEGVSYGAASTTSVMDNFSAAAQEGGSTIALLTAVDMTIDNGIEPKFVIGAKPAANLLWKKSRATGKATLLLVDFTMFNKFLNETASSMQLTMTDPDDNSYQMYMDNIFYDTGDQNMSGEMEIPLEMGFTALHDAVYTNVQWTKTPYVVSASPSLSPSKSPSVSPSASPSS